ncbi:DUF4062 domain-containing protein [Synechococcus sp. BA-132 BA5]|uniref:DUF4062 domain-containing protein n=1 Tax=Synechococcus sp. BA-132 BA5 TaxID=3110252 RepID=UPI002B1EB0EE|nr:DUF4062 domain-containing protein [Synechococcus sp. BA-132 BA5]
MSPERLLHRCGGTGGVEGGPRDRRHGGFAAQDKEPAQVRGERVQASDLDVGIFGSHYGSPVRDRPEGSYIELEFDTALAAGIPRLVFLLDVEAENPGIPGKWLRTTPLDPARRRSSSGCKTLD